MLICTLVVTLGGGVGMLYHSSSCLIFTLKNLNVSPKSSWTLPLSDYCQLLETSELRCSIWGGDTVAYTECRYARERRDRVATLFFHLIFIWRNWKTRMEEGKWEWRENPRCDDVESSPCWAGPLSVARRWRRRALQKSALSYLFICGLFSYPLFVYHLIH